MTGVVASGYEKQIIWIQILGYVPDILITFFILTDDDTERHVWTILLIVCDQYSRIEVQY